MMVIMVMMALMMVMMLMVLTMLSKPRAGHPQDLVFAYDADGDDGANGYDGAGDGDHDCDSYHGDDNGRLLTFIMVECE